MYIKHAKYSEILHYYSTLPETNNLHLLPEEVLLYCYHSSLH